MVATDPNSQNLTEVELKKKILLAQAEVVIADHIAKYYQTCLDIDALFAGLEANKNNLTEERCQEKFNDIERQGCD